MSHDSRFKKLGIIGKGGFATVYRAEDKKLNREVALKELHEKHAARADVRDRFIFEAEVAACLQCPNVPAVYDRADADHRHPYYVMQLVDGQTLSQIRRQTWLDPKVPLTPRNESLVALLRIFIEACEAVDYAHSRDVLHLDIKPSNIMRSEDQVFVMDWGLATYTSYARTLARNQMFEEDDWSPAGSSTPLDGPIGTPGFMSGEQAAGDHSRLSKQSDIYGLGATLYFLLTGQRAFEHSKLDDMDDFVSHVEQGDFPSPRQIRPNVPRALEAICLKAMATNPEDRYQNCGELAQAVQDWIATPVKRKRVLQRIAVTTAFFVAATVPPWLVRANQPSPQQHSEASFIQLTTAVETASDPAVGESATTWRNLSRH